MQDGFRSALEEWAQVVGPGRVLSRQDAEHRYGGSTIGVRSDITGAVRPTSAGEVQAIVSIAHRHSIPLYPVSTGRNWGYGTANPVTAACVLDLSEMQRIVDVDAELGLVTVEPGVTQGMLHEFLVERGLPFMVPVTGAGPTCSVLGNALERGFGITPHCDHFGAVMSVEAVLGDGRTYRGPFAEMGVEGIDRAHKWGIGPYVDGLFAQSGFGVVTRMTIALARVPEDFCAFFFGARSDSALEELVTSIRQVMRSTGGSAGFVNLMNAQRMLAMLEPFPEDTAVGGVIPDHHVARMAKRNGVMRWNGIGAIYGSKEVVRAARRTIRRLLRAHVDRLVFVRRNSLKWFRYAERFLPRTPRERVARMVHALEQSMDIMQGIPREVALPLAYWRSGRRPPPGEYMNPARDGCGLMWYAPLVVMKPALVRDYVETLTRICHEHGMNPLITLTTLSDRCFDSTVPLLFDRSDAAACSRAEDCYQALFEAGLGKGFVPYRVSTRAMSRLTRSGEFWRTVADLKGAVDPSNIVAPGRYARL
ncbi:MAG: FAD-binding oxidoreductase [Spiribacter salinus]|uniref:FAD-binding oxidoreductase n=1 Tax=Spiribacter salinus TaxID=1335746 RepID=A0A540VND2_9GAMM|nr:MAG: FAD-binding oxidoreductase [Spiribacter salinus]